MAGPGTRLSVVQTEPGIAARVQRLQAEARGLARKHVEELIAAMIRLQALSIEVSTGGDAYPAGIRDIARRLAEELDTKAQAIEAIGGRAQ